MNNNIDYMHESDLELDNEIREFRSKLDLDYHVENKIANVAYNAALQRKIIYINQISIFNMLLFITFSYVCIYSNLKFYFNF
jgi:hypothetical protein